MLQGSACCAQKIETTRLSFILTVKVAISDFHFNVQTLLQMFVTWFGEPSNTRPYGLNECTHSVQGSKLSDTSQARSLVCVFMCRISPC